VGLAHAHDGHHDPGVEQDPGDVAVHVILIGAVGAEVEAVP
jgi:hypothetical protein